MSFGESQKNALHFLALPDNVCRGPQGSMLNPLLFLLHCAIRY